MIGAESATLKHRTKSQIAYDFLRERIVSGTLKPGEHLVAKSISKQLTMSEIPVREALQRLNNEALVTWIPHGGARVSAVQTDEVAEALLIRSELEALATRLATDHLTDAAIAHLQSKLDAMDAIVSDGRVEEYSALNRGFHLAIYDLIPYPRLRGLIAQLLNQEPRSRSVFALDASRIRESHDEHKQILAALCIGDGVGAAEIVRAQKLKAIEVLKHAQ